MSTYVRLRLMDRMPSAIATLFEPLEDDVDTMFDIPTVLSSTQEDEAFSLLLAGFEGGSGIGHTLLYYKKHAGRWYRWMLEKPSLPKEQRWETVEAPFEGLSSAFALEDRLRMLRPNLSDEDVDAIKSSSRFNRDFIFPSGKYSGLTLGRVLDTDPDYVRWAGENIPKIASDLTISRA